MRSVHLTMFGWYICGDWNISHKCTRPTQRTHKILTFDWSTHKHVESKRRAIFQLGSFIFSLLHFLLFLFSTFYLSILSFEFFSFYFASTFFKCPFLHIWLFSLYYFNFDTSLSIFSVLFSKFCCPFNLICIPSALCFHYLLCCFFAFCWRSLHFFIEILYILITLEDVFHVFLFPTFTSFHVVFLLIILLISRFPTVDKSLHKWSLNDPVYITRVKSKINGLPRKDCMRERTGRLHCWLMVWFRLVYSSSDWESAPLISDRPDALITDAPTLKMASSYWF